MGLIIYIIRDHYIIYHDCKRPEEEIELLIGNNKRPGDHNLKTLFQASCSFIGEFYRDKNLHINCKACGKRYILGEREIEPARKSCENLF